MTIHADEPEESEQQQRIAERAYQLFRERGATDGYDVADWLEAERQILIECSEDESTDRTAIRGVRPRSRAEAAVVVSDRLQ